MRRGALLVAISVVAGAACSASVKPRAAGTTQPGATATTAAATTGQLTPAKLPQEAAKLPAPDPTLVASGLLDKAAYAQALGEPVVGVEDAGGIPSDGMGFTSITRVVTASGIQVELRLHSEADVASASKRFHGLASRNSAAVPYTAGDEAVMAGNEIVVRKAAQVLDVEATATGVLEKQAEDAKINGRDPTALFDRLQKAAPLVVAPLTAKLSGAPSTTRALALPSGAVDPCALGVVGLAKALYGVSDPTVGYDFAAKGPGLVCRLEANGSTMEVESVTDAQLQAAAPPTTAADQFAGDQTATSQAAPTNLPDGAVAAFATPSGEYTEALRHDPFGWIINLGFPGITRRACLDPDAKAKGEIAVDWLTNWNQSAYDRDGRMLNDDDGYYAPLMDRMYKIINKELPPRCAPSGSFFP